MIKETQFSECGKYRYLLTRIWNDELPYAMCVGLNPSTAGSKDKNGNEKDDPTITRLIASLQYLGYGGLKMVNLFGLISSKPEALTAHPNPYGNNEFWISTTAYTVQDIIFCWGGFKQAEFMAKKMKATFPDAKCFGKNANGSPWHPLAMMYAGIQTNQCKLLKFKDAKLFTDIDR
jgi:hypothetical protein